MHDAMDMSPLPRKAAYFTHVEIASPISMQAPEDDEMMLDSPVQMSRQSLEPPRPVVAEYV